MFLWLRKKIRLLDSHSVIPATAVIMARKQGEIGAGNYCYLEGFAKLCKKPGA